MGFNTALIMLYPEVHTAKEYRFDDDLLEDVPTGMTKQHIVWKAREAIYLGHVTRMEKLTSPKFRDLGYTSHERAGICMASIILRSLVSRVYEKYTRSTFAPPFLVYDTSTHAQVFEYANVINGAQHVDVMSYERSYSLGRKEFCLLEEFFHDHNKRILMGEESFKTYLAKEYHLVLDAPALWGIGSTIAQWFDEAETSCVEEWQELLKDPLALALVRARREYLREVGKAGVHVLFSFPPYG